MFDTFERWNPANPKGLAYFCWIPAPWALYPSSERPRVIMRHTPHFSKPVEASTWHDHERVKFWDPKFGEKKHAYKQFAEASPNKNAFNILEVYCFFMEELQVCKVS